MVEYMVASCTLKLAIDWNPFDGPFASTRAAVRAYRLDRMISVHFQIVQSRTLPSNEENSVSTNFPSSLH